MNETLEQIAIRVAKETANWLGTFRIDDEEAIEFSRRLIAEIGKQQEPVAITREWLFGLVAELKGGSNLLSGKHNVYSYSRAPKIAADLLSALANTSLRDLISELRGADKWKREGFGHFKDSKMTENGAPFKAAELLDQMLYAAPITTPEDVLDAARYRWLRDEHDRTDPVARTVWKLNHVRNSSDWCDIAGPDQLDTAIDAAMTAAQEGK